MTNYAPLIILGMHRSGTSLLANWLQCNGLSIGKRLMDKANSNINGHFEDLDFVDFHEKVFARNNIAYGGLSKLDALKLEIEEHKELQHLIRSKAAKNSTWGFKDPRTCLFLDAYYEIVPNAKFIVVFRPAAYVVDSLLRRQKSETAYFFRNGNLKQKLIYKLKSNFINREIEYKFLNAYTEAWISYNNEVLRLLNRLPNNKFIVVKMPEFNDKKIFDWLKNTANLNLSYVPYKEVFNASLINSIPPSVKLPRHLKEKINKIEHTFSLF